MGILRDDLSASKKYCLDLLEQLEADKNHPRYGDSARIVLGKIMLQAQNWDVDQTKLEPLLKSMLLSQNIRGASRFLQTAIPDKQFKRWPLYATLGALGIIAWYVRNA